MSLKRVPALFFRTGAGTEPVRDWLKALDQADRRRIGEDIKLTEYGWPIGMPTCRPMGESLHEVRSRISHNRIARVLFYIDARQRMVLLHAFIKKSQATPAEDLRLARANKRKHEQGLS